MVSVAPTGCEEDVVVKAEAMEEEEEDGEEEEEEEAPDDTPLLVLLPPLLLIISDRNEQHQPAHGVTNNKIPIPDRYLFGNLENPRRPPTSTAQKMYNRLSNQPREICRFGYVIISAVSSIISSSITVMIPLVIKMSLLE